MIYLDKPKGWRMGQTLFNFLEWLKDNGGAVNQCGERCADPFYETDAFLEKKFEEFMKIYNK